MINLLEGNLGLHGTTTIKGSTPFRIAASDFIISPLSADGELHLNSICNGTTEDVAVDTISSGYYTKIEGAIPYIEFYVDTDETFYIKW